MELYRELWNEIAKHMRRTREAVQQHDGWRSLGTCFAIEELESVYGGVLKRCYDEFSFRVTSDVAYRT